MELQLSVHVPCCTDMAATQSIFLDRSTIQTLWTLCHCPRHSHHCEVGTLEQSLPKRCSEAGVIRLKLCYNFSFLCVYARSEGDKEPLS